jgi:hypothetical protein
MSRHRYWLPGQEARWRQDPLYAFNKLIEEDRQLRERLARG